MYQPNDFLNSENFYTEFDKLTVNAELATSQYNKGLKIGATAESVSIAINDVWSAKMLDGGHISSYERIGYHACTAHLLCGFLDSGVAIYVYRSGSLNGPTKIQ